MDDRDILRELARQVRELAQSPEMARLRSEWTAHNDLTPGRPMVLVSPEGSWPELLPQEVCRCVDPQCRQWEWTLRARLYQRQVIRDDSPMEPWFNVHWRVNRGDYGVEIPYVHGDNRGSYVWDPPIKDLDADFAKLRPRQFSVDRAATLAEMQRANEMFGDILPVRIHGSLWWTVGLTREAVLLIGLEQLMLAMYDQPESLHRLMAFLRDDALAYIRWCQSEGLLTSNTGADGVGSGGIGCTASLASSGESPARLADLWGFSESQETVGVSPTMFEEFVLPYQTPLMEQFGLNYYGCCEPLEHRIGSVMRSIPRLRRVSVAPQANQRALAEALGPEHIYVRKADPVPVCVDFTEEGVRADLRRTLSQPVKGPMEIILKDTHTVQNEPWRIARWVELAREEVAKVTGR